MKSGNMPIPGATVTAVNTLTGQKAVAWTGVDGMYSLQVQANGRYVVRTQMAAFAPLTHEAVIDATHRDVQADLELVLLSRAQQAAPASMQQAGCQRIGVRGHGGGERPRLSKSCAGAVRGSAAGQGVDQIAPAGMPVPGLSADSATESVAVSGSTSNPMGSMSSDEFRERVSEFREQPGRIRMGEGYRRSRAVGDLVGGGGFGGGPGILTAAAGAAAAAVLTSIVPHGSLYYSGGNSALDAAPFSLTGRTVDQGGIRAKQLWRLSGRSAQHSRISIREGRKTFFFVNYNGSRSENPFDQFSTVPTAAERAGDFSQATYGRRRQHSAASAAFLSQPQPMRRQCRAADSREQPAELQTAPGCQISPIAQGLLRTSRCPICRARRKNFHFVTSSDSNSDDLNVRLIHNFGAAPTGQRRGRGCGGFAAPATT